MAKDGFLYHTIIDEVLSAIEVVGIEKTIKSLRDAKSNNLILQDLNIEFILNSVSQVTSVSKERILSGSDRTDDRKIAVALCVFFIKNEFYYSYAEIKKIIARDESALSRYYSIVENRSNKPKTEFDKSLDSYFKKINLLITEKKLKNA